MSEVNWENAFISKSRYVIECRDEVIESERRVNMAKRDLKEAKKNLYRQQRELSRAISMLAGWELYRPEENEL